MTLINDTQRLISATRNGYSIPVYDDGYGKLYIHRDSTGISGIVRAQSWEDAYSICEDEFFPEANETVEEMENEYSTIYQSGLAGEPSGDVPFVGVFTEHPYWQDAFGFRPNGPNQKDTLNHGIYAKDLNGDFLDELTPELAERLEITLTVEDEE